MIIPIAERLALLDILPRNGTATGLRLVREIIDKVDLTEDEVARIGLKTEKQDGGSLVSWDGGPTAADVDVTLSSDAFDLVGGLLNQISSAGRLTLAQLPLYERFCGGE